MIFLFFFLTYRNYCTFHMQLYIFLCFTSVPFFIFDVQDISEMDVRFEEVGKGRRRGGTTSFFPCNHDDQSDSRCLLSEICFLPRLTVFVASVFSSLFRISLPSRWENKLESV